MDVARLASLHGFTVVGVTTGEPLVEALEALTAWCAAGCAGDLGWMTRDPAQRADPRTLLPGVRSVISLAVPYTAPAAPFDAQGRYGRVARYAWGLDYHHVLLPRLQTFARALVRELGHGRFAVASDHSPLLERALAARAGLGFVGKNTCLIRPRLGSWFLLGEVLLNRDLASAGPWAGAEPDAGHGCGACRRCLPACPTGAFLAPYVLDARRCISYWTIEQTGALPNAVRAGLGPWVFGCDVCQEVCPFNGLDAPAPWPELTAACGVGGRLDLPATLEVRDDAAFARRFAGTPLLRPGRAALLRNAAVVARNVGAGAAVPALCDALASDRSPLVRAHALWALGGLDPARTRPLAERARRDDPDPDVRAEALGLLG